MAKFFRFIFHLLLVAYIAIILALVVPPLVGYTTATVMEDTEANQPVGTVNYAKRIPLQDLKAGDKILVTGSNSVNVYTVQNVDQNQSTVTVADDENTGIPVRSYVYRMAYTVPFIGYVIIALQTMEGVIVLAMVAVLLILLCVLTSIWSRKAKEKKRRRLEREKEKREAEIRAAEAAKQEAEKIRRAEERSQVMNARAEAYFAAKKAEDSRPAPIEEEYEDFPPKAAPASAQSDPLQAVTKPVATEFDYFDDDEEDDEADFWLHDDVDDEDLFAGLNNRDATESLMATARLFAINRAAQLKEQMAKTDQLTTGKAEVLDKTRVLSEEKVPVTKAPVASAPVTSNPVASAPVTSTPVTKVPVSAIASDKPAAASAKNGNVKEIAVDKIINLKELKELDDNTEQIVLTINIKVVSE